MPSLHEETYTPKVSGPKARRTGGASAARDAIFPLVDFWASLSLFLVRSSTSGKGSTFLIFPVQVPPKSIVQRAKLTIFPFSNQATTPFPVRIGIVKPDGKWNLEYPTTLAGYNTSRAATGLPSIQLKNAAATILANSFVGGVIDSFTFLQVQDGFDAIGASILATSSSTLDHAVINVGATAPAPPPDQAWIEVWSVTETSPGIWAPLAKLAESERVLCEDLPVSAADVTFPFLGANQIAITSGQRYHAKFRSTQEDAANRITISLDPDLASADRRGFTWSHAGGLAPPSYLTFGDVPLPTATGSDAVIPGKLFGDAFAGQVELGVFTQDVPKSFGNASYSPDDTFDFATALTAYFASSDYVQGAICLVIDPMEAVPLDLTKFIHGAQPTSDAHLPQLTIEWQVDTWIRYEQQSQPAVKAAGRGGPAVLSSGASQPSVRATGRARTT